MTWERDEPQSPCVKLCAIHREAGICVGCHRTLNEIASWGALDDAERRRIMGELPGRASLVKVRRGGRRRVR